MGSQISRCDLEQPGVVIQVPKGTVARHAKQPSDRSGRMIMVDARSSHLLIADGASTKLLDEHGSPALPGDPILVEPSSSWRLSPGCGTPSLHLVRVGELVLTNLGLTSLRVGVVTSVLHRPVARVTLIPSLPRGLVPHVELVFGLHLAADPTWPHTLTPNADRPSPRSRAGTMLRERTPTYGVNVPLPPLGFSPVRAPLASRLSSTEEIPLNVETMERSRRKFAS